MPAVDVLPFPMIAGSLAVDFVNTEVIEAGERRELLGHDRDLLRWAQAAGLGVPRAMLRAARDDALDAAVRPFRAALRALFEARIDGKRPEPDDLARLNRVLTRARRGRGIAFRGRRFVAEAARIATPAQVLEAIAEDAGRLLTSDDLGGLHRCANQRCILLFVDRSRRASRRWCSMEVCGNRAKVQAHYRRTRDRRD